MIDALPLDAIVSGPDAHATAHTEDVSLSVVDIMTPDPVSAAPNTPVGEAMVMLDQARARHLPVVEDGRLVGMVSDRDLREYRMPLAEALWQPEQARRLMATPISDLMATTVVMVGIDTPVEEAAQEMLENAVGAVPVVEAETEEILGILSYVDVLNYFVRQ